MKLYATIENEKGKREGIGGNEYLDFDIRVGNMHLAYLTLRYTDEIPDGHGSGWALFDNGDEPIYWVLDDEKKGEKQKGELCTDGNPHRYNAEGDCTGEDCYKSKGNKQKGEKICSVIGCTNKSKYIYTFENLCEQHNKQS